MKTGVHAAEPPGTHLCGKLDGLNAVVPLFDADYYRQRPASLRGPVPMTTLYTLDDFRLQSRAAVGEARASLEG